MERAPCRRLQALPGGALVHLSALRVLNLEFNNLMTLPSDAFLGLKKLKVRLF